MKRNVLLPSALFTALATAPAWATDYFWIGGESGDFRAATNWSLTENGDAASTFPGNTDTAVFNSSATVSITANANVKTIQIGSNATLTLTGTANDYCIYSSITGEGSLVVNSAILRGQSNGNVAIDVPVQFSGSCTIKPSLMKRDTAGGTLTFNKAITGAGIVSLGYAYTGSKSCAIFNGDMSGFTGAMSIVCNTSNDTHHLTGNASDCSGSTWSLYAANSLGARFPFKDSGTYKFGGIKAHFSESMSDAVDTTLELGALDKGTYIDGAFPESITVGMIWKGATSILTNDCANTDGITIAADGGKVYFPSASGIPTNLTFTENGGVIVPDIALIPSITNILNIAEGKTVTITLKDYFSFNVTAADLADSSWDWRADVTAPAGVYVWCGTSGGNFGDTSNWKVNDAAPSTISTVAKALVTGDATININGNYNLNGACFLGDVTFTQSNGYLNMYGDIYGPGRIVLTRPSGKNGIVLRNSSNICNVYADVEVKANSENGATVQFGAHNNGTTSFHGAISGAGPINVAEYNNSGAGYTYIYGDMSGFTGTMTINAKNSSTFLQFATPNTVAGAVVCTTGNGALCGEEGIYAFGSLSGKVKGGANAVTIVTGGADTAPKSIAYTAGTGSWTLKKQGSQQLTVTGSNFASYKLNNGTLVLPSETEAIATDVSGCSVVTASAPTYTLSTNGGVIAEDGDTCILVSGEWLTSNNLTGQTAEALTADRADGNGYSYLACYALGLDPTNPESVPLATYTPGTDGNLVVRLSGCGTIPDGVTIELKLLSATSIGADATFTEKETASVGSGIAKTFTITPSAEMSCEYFKVGIDIR